MKNWRVFNTTEDGRVEQYLVRARYVEQAIAKARRLRDAIEGVGVDKIHTLGCVEA